MEAKCHNWLNRWYPKHDCIFMVQQNSHNLMHICTKVQGDWVQWDKPSSLRLSCRCVQDCSFTHNQSRILFGMSQSDMSLYVKEHSTTMMVIEWITTPHHISFNISLCLKFHASRTWVQHAKVYTKIFIPGELALNVQGSYFLTANLKGYRFNHLICYMHRTTFISR